MDAIEKAIRNAFEKGNAEDRDFREKVYRSAFAALDRALKASPTLTVEAAINRRKALQATITQIESEFVPVVPAVEPIASRSQSEPRLDDIRPQRDEGPVLDAPRKAARPASAAVAVEGERIETRARRKRRIFPRLFIGATLLAAIVIGGWWAFQTGLLKTPAERDTSIPNPPQSVQDEDYIPENEAAPIAPGQADPDRDWINVFSTADAAMVSSPGETTAEVMQDESGSFLRIRSGKSGSAILFDIGQGVLEQLAGKTATFDIVARAEEGKETEMSVDCNFGELGDCGRKRYAVGYEKGDYLFEVDFSGKQPGAGGTIAINSDFANEGKAVDIYEIKVSVSQ
ncbi:hypothetical protein EET67_04230 [Pseudaminobacter arsenicus]|uniref:Biotin transporter BioY n=1 Tax=Borborobacter arsenicus TaxID=1851146 RepID=A0A432V9M1_9HYPH|nr:hypothetical protein [Pseudaminobacter arsenicus]RUM98860.1 hypothetical protein EET67_04230 [Pseudaminobacter arsenicus]